MDTALILLGCEPARNFARNAWAGCPPPNRKLPAPQFNRPPCWMEAAVEERINEIRQQNGLNPLQKK